MPPASKPIRKRQSFSAANPRRIPIERVAGYPVPEPVKATLRPAVGTKSKEWIANIAEQVKRDMREDKLKRHRR